MSDLKLDDGSGSFTADEKQYTNFYPYGMPHPNRSWEVQGDNYRYGFNGVEKEGEVYGKGNLSAMDFRMYDSRVGRWWGVDKIVKVHESPYAAFFNNPINYADPSGLQSVMGQHQPSWDGREFGGGRPPSNPTGKKPEGAGNKPSGATNNNSTTTSNSNTKTEAITPAKTKNVEVSATKPEVSTATATISVANPQPSTKGGNDDSSGFWNFLETSWSMLTSDFARANTAGQQVSAAAREFNDGLTKDAPAAMAKSAYKLATTTQAWKDLGNSTVGAIDFMSSGMVMLPPATEQGWHYGMQLTSGIEHIPDMTANEWGQASFPLFISLLTSGAGYALSAESSLLSGGLAFADYKAMMGGTETLAFIQTSTGVQRISTEFHHVFITQRFQRAYNVPNWLVNNRINVWKVNTIQHALLDAHRFKFLRAGLKPDVGWFGKYNWFTPF